jgi:PAS domain S-box-containing protein
MGAYAALRSQIIAGEWLPGSRLPNQMTLAALLGVAPLTLRQALERLETEGMISRQRRRGMYVQRTSAIAVPRLDEMFELMFQHAPIGVSVLDTSGCLLRCNPALLKLLGYSASELEGNFIRDYTHPEDVARLAQAISTAISEHRRFFKLEERYIRKDGEVIWCRLLVYSIIRDDEEVGSVGLIERISR